MNDATPGRIRGLSQAEVAQRIREGKVNVNSDVPTKTVSQIVAEHAFTPFNGLMIALAVLVLFTGQFSNVFFVLPVFANLIIGAFQEIRAKKAIDKLSILAARPVRVIRDGVEQSIPIEQVVLDDCVRLGRGDQVPADSVVLAGEASLNESLITGESVPVDKRRGSELVSGSFLDSGSVICKVIRVGAEGYAARINAGARQVRKSHSEILDSLNDLIRVVTVIFIPLGIFLFVRTVQTGTSTVDAILTTVSAIVGMVPQGLILLSSSVFALAATRLATKHVLVQKLYSIESFARVDVMCLDKTGTITSGEMEVKHIQPFHSTDNTSLLRALVALIAAAGEDLNETSLAIRSFLQTQHVRSEAIARYIPFSSATKCSGCITRSGAAYVMGAAQFVLPHLSDEIVQDLQAFGDTARVLVVASCDGFSAQGAIVGTPQLLGYVALQDTIRESAPHTIRFFTKRDVRLVVISGDDPKTVSAIAQRVGIPGATEYVDASTLTTPLLLRQAVDKYCIFGRVTPDQKRSLIRAFRYAGHCVAMTGDGVNDVLALREADCSVAVSSGSDVARNVADLVLVDNDFAHMAEIVAEGRKSINNLQRSASLFTVKTVFTMLLAFICAVFPPYPFMPIQSTLISVAVIGVPSLMLAVEPNQERLKGHFLVNVLARSIPASLGIVLGLVLILFVDRITGMADSQTSTMCMYVVSAVGFALISTLATPLTFMRAAVLVVVAGIMIFGCTTFASFFEVASISVWQCILTLIAVCIGVISFACLYRRITKNSVEDGFIGHFVTWLGGRHDIHRQSRFFPDLRNLFDDIIHRFRRS